MKERLIDNISAEALGTMLAVAIVFGGFALIRPACWVLVQLSTIL